MTDTGCLLIYLPYLLDQCPPWGPILEPLLSLDTPQTRKPDLDVQVPGMEPELELLGALDTQMEERLA